MKLDIPIILIDESIVDYGFRVLMSGYQPEPFAKNPILLLQHGRMGDGIVGVNSLQFMPMGKWNDIQVQGNKLVGYPEFDDDDTDAVKVQGKVKKGYYNAASIWIDPIECSDDDSLKVPGQYGPTITKWSIREASIVDIPNCRNAVAIRNSAGNKILLSGINNDDAREINNFLKTLSPTDKKNTMDKKLLCAKLGLDEKATDEQISEKLSAILTNATAHTQLSAENTTLKTEVIRLKKEAGEKKIADLVDGAITGKKLMVGDREDYIKLATADYDTAASIIGKMKPYESIETKLGGSDTSAGVNKIELEELMKLSGTELWKQGKLERLQALSIDHFKLKYKEAFGIEYAIKPPKA